MFPELLDLISRASLILRGEQEASLGSGCRLLRVIVKLWDVLNIGVSMVVLRWGGWDNSVVPTVWSLSC